MSAAWSSFHLAAQPWGTAATGSPPVLSNITSGQIRATPYHGFGISGSNLSGVTHVTIGGTRYPVHVIFDTLMTVYIGGRPPGVYTIQAFNQFGASNTLQYVLTPKVEWFTGFEAGLGIINSNSDMANDGLPNPGPPGSVAAPPVLRSGGIGAYAWRCNPTAATRCIVQRTPIVPNSPYRTIRFYLYVATLPAVTATFMEFQTVAGGTNNWKLYTNASGQVISRWGNGGADAVWSGVTLVAGNWYLFELEVDASYINPSNGNLGARAKGRVNGVDRYEVITGTGSENVHSGIIIGSADSVTYDLWYDDIVISNERTDFPIGGGPGSGVLVPDGVDATNAGTSFTIQPGGATLAAGNVATALAAIDDTSPASVTSTDYIEQTTAGAATLDVTFSNPPTGYGAAAVRMSTVIASSAASATDVDAQIRRSTSGTANGAVYTDLSHASTSLVAAGNVFNYAIDAYGQNDFSESVLSATFLRWGGAAGALAARPRLHAAFLEYEAVLPLSVTVEGAVTLDATNSLTVGGSVEQVAAVNLDATNSLTVGADVGPQLITAASGQYTGSQVNHGTVTAKAHSVLIVPVAAYNSTGAFALTGTLASALTWTKIEVDGGGGSDHAVWWAKVGPQDVSGTLVADVTDGYNAWSAVYEFRGAGTVAQTASGGGVDNVAFGSLPAANSAVFSLYGEAWAGAVEPPGFTVLLDDFGAQYHTAYAAYRVGSAPQTIDWTNANTPFTSIALEITYDPVDYGIANFDANHSLTVSGAIERVGSVDLNAGNSLTVTGVVERLGAATLDATNSLTVSGSVTQVASATLDASNSLTVGASVTQIASVNLDATNSLAVSGSVTQVAAVNLDATNTLTVSGVVERLGAVDLDAISTMTAEGAVVVIHEGAVVLNAGNNLSVSGVRTVHATALTVTAIAPNAITALYQSTGSVTDIDESPDSPDAAYVSADLNSTWNGLEVTFPAQSTRITGLQVLRVRARRNSFSTVDPIIQGGLTGGVSVGWGGFYYTVQGYGRLTSTEQIVEFVWDADVNPLPAGTALSFSVITDIAAGDAWMDVQSIEWRKHSYASLDFDANHSLVVGGVVERFGAVTLDATNSLAVSGVTERLGSVTLDATNSLIVSGAVTQVASANLDATNSLTVSAAVEHIGAATLDASNSMTVAASAAQFAAANLDATNALVVSAAVEQIAAVNLDANHSFIVSGVTERLGSVDLDANHALAVSASVEQIAVANFDAINSLVVSGVTERLGSVTLDAANTLVVGAVITQIVAVDLDATNSLVVAGAVTQVAAVNLDATNSLTVAAAVEQIAAVVLDASNSLAVASQVAQFGSVTLTAIASLRIGYRVYVYSINGTGWPIANRLRALGYYVHELTAAPASAQWLIDNDFRVFVVDSYAWGIPADILTMAYDAYQLGVSVLTSGNDTTSTAGNPIWTGSSNVGGSAPRLSDPAVVAPLHPVAQGWTTWTDSDAMTVLTGVRAQAVTVATWTSTATSAVGAGVVTGAAIIAEQGASSRYVHIQPIGQPNGLIDSTVRWLMDGVSPSVTQIAAATLDATNSLTVAGVVERLGVVNLDATNSLTVSGGVTQVAAVDLDASHSLTVSASVEQVASANLDATNSLVVSGSAAQFAAANFDATNTLVVSAQLDVLAAVNLDAANTLVVSGVVERLGAVALDANHLLTVGAEVVHLGAVVLDAAHDLVVTGVVTRLGAVDLDANHSLIVSGVTERLGSVDLDASHSLIVSGLVTRLGAVDLDAVSDLVVAAIVTRLGSVDLDASHNLTIGATVAQFAVVDLDATHSMTVGALVTQVAVANFDGNSSLLVAAIVTGAPLNLTATATGQSGEIFVDWDAPAGGIDPDSYAVYRQGGQYLTGNDSNFASGVGGWTAGSASSLVTHDSIDGELRIQSTGIGGGFADGPLIPMATPPGATTDQVHLSADATMVVAAVPRTVNLYVRAYDSSNVEIGTLTLVDSITLAAGASGVLDGLFAMPAGATKVRPLVRLSGAAIGDTVDIDDARIEPIERFAVPSDTFFIDGSATNYVPYTYWVRSVVDGFESSASNTATANAFVEYFGAALLDATNSLTVSGVVTRLGAVDLDATNSLTVSGVTERLGVADLDASNSLVVSADPVILVAAANFDATNALAVSGVVERLGAADLDATNALVVAATVAQFAAVLLDADHLLTVSGSVEQISAATLDATNSLTVAAQVEVFAAALLDAASSLNVSGVVTRLGAVDLDASNELLVAAVITQFAAAELDATNSLVVTGLVTRLGEALLDATPVLTVSAEAAQFAVVDLDATHTLIVSAIAEALAAAVFDADHQLTVGASVVHLAAVVLDATPELLIEALSVQAGGVILDATNDLIVSAAATTIDGTVVLDAESALLVAALVEALAAVDLDAASSLDVVGSLEVLAAVDFDVTGFLSVDAVVSRVVEVLLVAQSSLLVDGIVERLGAVDLDATSILVVEGITERLGGVILDAESSLTADAVVTRLAAVDLDANSALEVLGIVTRLGAVDLDGDAALAVDGIVTRFADALLDADHSLLVASVVETFSLIDFDATSSLEVLGGAEQVAEALLDANHQLVVAADVEQAAFVNFDATSDLIIDGVVTRLAAVNLDAAHALFVDALVASLATALFDALATLVAEGTVDHRGAVLLDAAAVLSVAAAIGVEAQVVLAAVALLSLEGTVTRFGQVVLTAIGYLALAARVTHHPGWILLFGAPGWYARPMRIYDEGRAEWVIRPVKRHDSVANDWVLA